MRFKKTEKLNHLLVLIDYENIITSIRSEEIAERKVLDFDQLREECLSIGAIDFSFVFIPEHMLNTDKISTSRERFYYGLSDYLHDKNFRIIACPAKNIKQKDRVDYIMTEM